MNVKESVKRTINERGNQVLTIEGVVLSTAQEPVLPEGREYIGRVTEMKMAGGAMFFKFQMEATGPQMLSVNTSLIGQLDDPSVCEELKGVIRENLSVPQPYPDVEERKRQRR